MGFSINGILADNEMINAISGGYGIRLKKAINKSGKTLKEINAHTGIALSTLSNIQNGKQTPKKATLKVLSSVLNVRLEYLTMESQFMNDEEEQEYYKLLEIDYKEDYRHNYALLFLFLLDNLSIHFIHTDGPNKSRYITDIENNRMYSFSNTELEKISESFIYSCKTAINCFVTSVLSYKTPIPESEKKTIDKRDYDRLKKELLCE